MSARLKSLISNDFLSFARKAIREASGEKIGDDKYLEYLATKLTAFDAGENPRLLINLPPRHLKTQLSSVALAAWTFAHDPSAKIMVVTCSEELAKTIAGNIRSILQADWFKETFATRLKKNHGAVRDFGTTAGGRLYAAPIGGSITGLGADLIIVDDPHEQKDAANPRKLARTIELFNSVVISRLNSQKRGKIIVIAHRVREDDLSGCLIRQRKWHHVVLPMIAITDELYKTQSGNWRRSKGELLRPDEYTAENIEVLKQSINPSFEMLFQQDADSCALPSITKDAFPTFISPPSSELPCVMSVDTGMAAGARNGFSTIQMWCPDRGRFYLIDQWRKQCDFQELLRKFNRYAARHRPSAVLIEVAANGHALASMLKPKLLKYVHEITPKTSKTARLHRNIDTILGQRVRLWANGDWRKEFIDEFVQFPHGHFTDQVDATTQFLDWISKNPKLEVRPKLALVAVAFAPPRFGTR